MPLSSVFFDRLASDPALAGFVALRGSGVRALVRREHQEEAERLGLAGPPAAEAGTVRGGRQPHPVVELADGGRAVVRRYRRGGALRHLNADRYFLPFRALAEARATERARAAGVRVPEVLAAVERRTVPVGYTASLATRWIPAATELAAWLPGRAAAEREAVLREVGRQVGWMHAGGIAHPDLNLRNVLVTAAGEVYVLDFDRATLFAGPVPARRRARDLRRLGRSARKLAAPLDARGWAALREGYGAGWPAGADLG